MMRRLTVQQLAAESPRHEVTIRRALEAQELHGTQAKAGGRWTIREDCAEAWLDRQLCEHQAANVTPIRTRRPA